MGGSQNKTIKKQMKEVQDISPYSEMNNVEGNHDKIIDLIITNMDKETTIFDQNENLKTEKDAIDSKYCAEKTKDKKEINKETTFKSISETIDAMFSKEERAELDRRFLLYSSDGIMSNRQFWNLLDLGQISNTTFAKMFYKTACDFNDNTKLDHLKFMEKAKFYQFVAIFTKTKRINEDIKKLYKGDPADFPDTTGDTLEMKKKSFAWAVKLRFINSLFDADGNEEVDRLEFRNFMSSFIEMILASKFECGPIQEQIQSIIQIEQNSTTSLSQLMEKVLDLYVDEVFAHHSYNGDVLTFEEWKNWLYDSITGYEEVLDFSATVINNALKK